MRTFFNPDLVGVDFLFQSVAVDTEHLSGLHLVAIVSAQSDLDEGALDLFHNDAVQTIEFNLGFALLLEEDFQFALYEFLEANGREVRYEQLIRTVQVRCHIVVGTKLDGLQIHIHHFHLIGIPQLRAKSGFFEREACENWIQTPRVSADQIYL